MDEQMLDEVVPGTKASMGADVLEPMELDDGTELKVTDIVFECPHCGKSLAIDYRGAGLITSCTECAKPVEVPIPEGMDLSDLDQTPEGQELRILNLRRSLANAEARIAELEEHVSKLEGRRAVLEKTRAEAWHRFEEITRAGDVMRKAQLELSTAMGKIIDVSQRKL